MLLLPRSLLIGAALLTLAACAPEHTAPAPASAEDTTAAARRIEADLRFLADDLLEGRETGTRGYDLAALYVASEFRKLGLEPAAAGSYLQPVPLLRARAVREGARFALVRDGQTRELAFEQDYVPSANFNEASSEISAPLVFVGQAVHAPELGQDHFAGVDVRGKIAVLLANAPSSLSNDERAFHASRMEKARLLAERGAIGTISIGDPRDEEKRPWALGAKNWGAAGMRLRAGDGRAIDSFPELRVRVSLRATLAEAIFAGSPHSADEVFAMMRENRLKPFDLPGTATLTQATRMEAAESFNVVARLAGTDATLAAEHVVLTAHLDHLGIGAEIDGDAIYNGALDNAIGVSILLEAARRMATTAEGPRRSLLFVALTGEEKGLLGAQQFVATPPVAKGSIVANVNMDMPVVLGDLVDMVPIGIEHSSLKGLVEAAATDMGMALSPDPKPEETVFVRSDQYAFIRAGIPAVYLDSGVKGRDPHFDGIASLDGFLDQHYHRPSDDANQSIHYPTAARVAALNALIGQRIADAPQRPSWNEGDFFAKKFAQPAAD
ncbi:MAG: M28 family peptidase [Rhodanobacteraceae bacterium]|jgi:Zn-dependent M28 family amino/carboxypeptidase|nr:M28 family peptidase [Rhodanobacteraceae bacterium]MBL0039970.1 M28 family peptidase [Xanthomonadales bacterium]MBP6078435.1 M28 family peptidase [Xanthomonadales bacterium]